MLIKNYLREKYFNSINQYEQLDIKYLLISHNYIDSTKNKKKYLFRNYISFKFMNECNNNNDDELTNRNN